MDSRALIIGGTGQVGFAAARRLVAAGWAVTVAHRGSGRVPEGAVSVELDRQDEPTVLTRTNYRHMYYSAAQQLAHHAIGGCLMQTGDLLGSGTISGPGKTEYGSMLELSWNGKEPIPLAGGGTRSFIEDGDTIAITGFAQGEGYRIGFGSCVGTILPSPQPPA